MAASEVGAFGLSQIAQVAVPVTDIERTIPFYRDILGMMLDGPAKAQAGNSSVIYYRVSDLQAAFTTLSKRGVQFEAKPHLIAKMPDHELWMAFFRDPDKNLLALMSEVRQDAATL
jgi:methylmalonyl-CoA/ethylmalonyl-CoA epimerase